PPRAPPWPCWCRPSGCASGSGRKPPGGCVPPARKTWNATIVTRGQRTEDRGQRTEESNNGSSLSSVLCPLLLRAPAMISRFFIDRPIFATVLSIVITLAGGVAVFNLPV